MAVYLFPCVLSTSVNHISPVLTSSQPDLSEQCAEFKFGALLRPTLVPALFCNHHHRVLFVFVSFLCEAFENNPASPTRHSCSACQAPDLAWVRLLRNVCSLSLRKPKSNVFIFSQFIRSAILWWTKLQGVSAYFEWLLLRSAPSAVTSPPRV